MYAVTLSSALFLLEKYAGAVSVAAAGVILGWPFSILVFLPVTVYSLIRGSFRRVFLSGLLTSLCFLVSKSLRNSLFYNMYEFDWSWQVYARFFRLLLITTAMVDWHSRCSIFWNITFLVVAKVTCMEPRGFHFTSGMDSTISILPSSWLFFSWGLYHLLERNMLLICW